MAFSISRKGRHGSVVEHIIGNDEVESSILSGGTIRFRWFLAKSQKSSYSVAAQADMMKRAKRSAAP
jgi:hypothetical protein